MSGVDPVEMYWNVAEVIKRIRTHDFNQQEFEILMIAEALARDGRVRAIGRRVIDGDARATEWEAVPRHEWEDLRFTLSPRGRPHPGDAFRGQRLAWTNVKFCERDLSREWLDAVFARPRAIYRGDIIIPAPPASATSRTPMFDDEVRRALKWGREKWRRQWIDRFAERQRGARRWIGLGDIVEWCVQSTTTASRDAEARVREVAYQRLTDSVRKGEFERDARSKLLYLDVLVTGDGTSSRCRLTRAQFEIAYDAAATPPAPSLPLTVLNCCWLPRDMARRWLASHGYRWAPHFEPAPEQEATRHLTILLDEANARIGKAKFGADWIGKLSERERWLVKRYIDAQHGAACSILPGTITYVGPGGPFVPVNAPALAAEIERVRDRLEQMNDQYEQVSDWLEDRGFDIDAAQINLVRFEHAFAEVFSPAAVPERAPARSGGTGCERIEGIGRAPEGGAMAVSNRAPDWGWWSHVPTVTLHEAVALSLNIDPKQLRRASTHALIAGRQFDEGPEFERRLALANRCLGDTLPGPLNQLSVHYYNEAAAVRLREFARWAHSVEWRVPPELARLAGREQSGNAPILDPQEHVTTVSVLAEPEIEAGRATADAYTHSGFSGRPSKGKHLIDDEFDRRVGAGTALPSLADEAKALFDWFRQRHPTLARPTTKTIKENIRAPYREWKASRPEADTN
jgi:hypothetical protein